MDTFAFKQTSNGDAAHPLGEGQTSAHDFIWIDAFREDIALNPTLWQEHIFEQTGCRIDDFHVADILNVQHPSYFDLTHNYEILIFRKLISQHNGTVTLDPAALTIACGFHFNEKCTDHGARSEQQHIQRDSPAHGAIGRCATRHPPAALFARFDAAHHQYFGG